jgi:glycosyltransferase involved in cell wall biosynthesis
MSTSHTPSPIRLVHVTTVPMTLRFLAGQVGYLTARGFHISALSSPGDELDDFANREGVPVRAVTMERRITPLRDLVSLVRILRYFRRLRPHIVHAHTPKGGLLGTIAAWCAGVPVRIYHIRGLPLATATGARRIVLRFTERLACLLANRVLCVSESVRQLAIDEGLCSPDKVVVLHKGSGNGVDAQRRFNPDRLTQTRDATRSTLGIAADDLVIGFVGRVVREKGIGELLEAWTVLREEFPRLHLLIVGPFESHDELPAALLSRLHADPRICLTGPQRDTASHYAAMDLLVLPTYREGFPNVVLEAAAMELAVVATRVPGCVDAVVDGLTGTLVPARNPVALTCAVRRYLKDADVRDAHGRAARARALAEYQQERVWDVLHREYTRLLSRNCGPARPHTLAPWSRWSAALRRSGPDVIPRS